MFFIFNPTYLLVPHFFKLQALKIELSRPGGVEEGSAKDSSEGLKYLCMTGSGGLHSDLWGPGRVT